MRRRITQPGCPNFRRIAEGIARRTHQAVPFYITMIRNDVPYWRSADMAFLHCTCLFLTQSGHPRERSYGEFLATVSRDRSFIPFNPDARKVGNFEAAVLNCKWLFQDRIGPLLP